MTTAKEHERCEESRSVVHGKVQEMHSDEMQRKMFIMTLIAIILGTAVGRFIGTVAHNAALGFVAVVASELLFFSFIFLWLRHQRP